MRFFKNLHKAISPKSVSNALFGFDIFISYSHHDGQQYASALADDLSKTHDVYLDIQQNHAGQDLRFLTRVRVSNSRLLVVVGTEGAMSNSYWVRREVEVFSQSDRPPLIIDVGNAIKTSLTAPSRGSLAEWIQGKREIAPNGRTIDPYLWEEDCAPIVRGEGRLPAAHITEKVISRFSGDRVERIRLKVVTLAMLTLLGMSILSTGMFIEANRQRSLSEQRLFALEERASEVAASAALDQASLGHTHAALQLAADALPYRDGVLGGYDDLALTSGLAALFSRHWMSLDGIQLWILDAAFSRDGRLLVMAEQIEPPMGQHNRRLSVYDTDTGALINQVSLRLTDLLTVDFVAENIVLAGGRANFSENALALWDISSGDVSYIPFERNIYEIRGRTDLGFALLEAGDIYVFDLQSRTITETPTRSNQPWDARDGIALHPNGLMLASLNEGRLQIQNLADGEPQCDLPINQGVPVSVSFDSTGNHAAVFLEAGTLLTVRVSQQGTCEDGLQSPEVLASERFADNFCGLGQIIEQNHAWIEESDLIAVVTREEYRFNEMICVRTINWPMAQEVSHLSIVQDVEYVARLEGLIDQIHLTGVAAGLNGAIFDYGIRIRGGDFLPRHGYEIFDPETQSALNAEVPRQVQSSAQSGNQTTTEFPCPSDLQIGRNEVHSQWGRFMVSVSDFHGIFLTDIPSCRELGYWLIPGASRVGFAEQGRYLVIKRQGSTIIIDLQVPILSEDLPLELSRRLSEAVRDFRMAP